jgi:hypothetical protein
VYFQQKTVINKSKMKTNKHSYNRPLPQTTIACGESLLSFVIMNDEWSKNGVSEGWDD